MTTFFNKFRLGEEKESLSVVTATIENSVVFRGTNLWVLIFAIFLASLGLNMNAPSVIIGAILISPLMGPIMGLANSTRRLPLLVRLKGLSVLKPDEKQKVEDWLKVRTGASELDCIWQ
jgi:hypothetical protein